MVFGPLKERTFCRFTSVIYYSKAHDKSFRTPLGLQQPCFGLSLLQSKSDLLLQGDLLNGTHFANPVCALPRSWKSSAFLDHGIREHLCTPTKGKRYSRITLSCPGHLLEQAVVLRCHSGTCVNSITCRMIQSKQHR